ncbi:MAG: efflux transporter outer membrane subunit [Phycisphaerae bacterium]|nr:efflux transporter outer membrane subunit [Phycisphaerae bacterium]
MSGRLRVLRVRGAARFPLRGELESRQFRDSSAPPSSATFYERATPRPHRRTPAAYRAAVLGLASALLLPGCAVGPDYRSPRTDVPVRWHQSASNGLAPGDASVELWWQVFDDDLLSDLIYRAAENNLDLRLAILRIREARALRGIAAGELLPALSGQGSYERSKASANSLGGALSRPGATSLGARFRDSVARGVAGNALGQGLTSALPGAAGVSNTLASSLIGLIPQRRELPETDEQDLFATGFDASWEIDVFGGIRRNVESADAALHATVEDYRGVLVSLLAEVASTFIDVRRLQARIEATAQNIDLQRQTLSLTQSRFRLGLTSELDVRQAETNLATTEAELPLLQTALALAIYRMGVLIGQEPSAVWDELSAERAIPKPPSEVLVGVPVDILRRRPDIRAAERRLASQFAQIGVATADLYPRFTLSGTFAFEATDFNHAIDTRSIAYGFGPTVRWNIFDGLRNLHRIAAEEAAAQQAYVAYEQTVLLALEEVEGALVGYKREQDRYAALDRAVGAARRSTQVAERQYRDGLTDFQRVLDAQRSLVVLEDALAQSRGQIAVDLVAIYKALGGGWTLDAMPQGEYLDEPSGALADSVGYFFSGGRESPPWEGAPEDDREEPSDAEKPDAPPAGVEPTTEREPGSNPE